MNRVQRLTRVNCTIEREQTDDIHFFSAGKCTNQARTLLPRFSRASSRFSRCPHSYEDVEPCAVKTRPCNGLPK
jgi:hypothetical protein